MSFLEAYRRRQRRELRMQYLKAHLENLRAWYPELNIQDLGDVHGKRLLFASIREVADRSTVDERPPSRPS